MRAGSCPHSDHYHQSIGTLAMRTHNIKMHMDIACRSSSHCSAIRYGWVPSGKLDSVLPYTLQNSPVKMRAKRSRTSLPQSRNPLPDTVLRASKLVRQGWLRHQELALGKTGKRRLWEECYAVLFDQSLYLCPNEPKSTIAENTGEKVIP
ncbi:hypothetical protein ANCCAN_18480 [Ancylostoma caninum]|uniref:PH domain-containing protein n=1 Tax=Ancylostoma caninum TaxID=29170 RepID=A0A368FTY6_ANCCA|nr:hypothetical protein ANCCAN_18480 [Ancylostoma caninum]